jgi:hypothetical protein
VSLSADSNASKSCHVSRYKGRDHITTMGRCTYDGLQDDTCCTNGLLKTKHTKRFVIMGIESNDLTSKERQVRRFPLRIRLLRELL